MADCQGVDMAHVSSTSQGFAVRGNREVQWRRKPDSPTSVARELGACVYFMRSQDDLIKIGFTTNLAQRKRRFAGSTWTDMLAVLPGTLDDEQELHAIFGEHRARGDEWYHPHADIFDHIDGIRTRLGLSPVDRW